MCRNSLTGVARPNCPLVVLFILSFGKHINTFMETGFKQEPIFFWLWDKLKHHTVGGYDKWLILINPNFEKSEKSSIMILMASSRHECGQDRKES